MIRDLKDEPGVYAMRHMPTGKTYIGSSKAMLTRVRGHLSGLRSGRHCNPRLLALVKADGCESFDCFPLAKCDRADRVRREFELIAEHSPELNGPKRREKIDLPVDNSIIDGLRIPFRMMESQRQALKVFCVQRSLTMEDVGGRWIVERLGSEIATDAKARKPRQ